MLPITQDRSNSILGWFFTAEEIASALSSGGMLNPSIDLSNPCNLNCPYCYIEEKNSLRKERKPNELSYEETIKVIDDLRSSGAKTINIVGAGEPTLDPHFEKIIKAIAGHGMTTVLFTNGIRFCDQPDLVQFLYDNNVSVVLKYNTTSNYVQDLVAGREGYALKRDAALAHLLEIGFSNEQPTRLGIDVIVFQGNVDEVPKIHRWSRTKNIFPIAGEFIPAGRTEDGKFQGFGALEGFFDAEKDEITRLLQPITQQQRSSLVKEIETIDRSFGISRPETFAYFGGSICTQRLGLYVDIQGNIWPCVAKRRSLKGKNVDGLLGNVRQGDRPSEIWRRNSYLKDLRRTFSGGCPFKSPLDELTLTSQYIHASPF